jgi:CheY-like chemotaxis protein
LNGQPSVLIVDRSEETREVLQTALERRGVHTLSARRAETGMRLARRHRPDLIVLDLELDDAPCGAGVSPAFLGEPQGDSPIFVDHCCATAPAKMGTVPEYQPRLILLGNLRRWRDRLPQGEFVSKPYHYGPLIRKIEELLASDTPAGSFGTCPRCSSSAAPTRAAASN